MKKFVIKGIEIFTSDTFDAFIESSKSIIYDRQEIKIKSICTSSKNTIPKIRLYKDKYTSIDIIAECDECIDLNVNPEYGEYIKLARNGKSRKYDDILSESSNIFIDFIDGKINNYIIRFRYRDLDGEWKTVRIFRYLNGELILR